jgi:DNA-binding transcriptional MerR regulator
MKLLVGELAGLTKMTVRTLQHYDNIGLLKPSSHTEGGRRCYDEKDMLKLEQIVFFKSLGFSLAEIKEKIIVITNLSELSKVLELQSQIIEKRILQVQSSFAGIQAVQKIIGTGRFPDYQLLSSFISLFSEVSAWEWVPGAMDETALAKLTQINITPKKTFEQFIEFKTLAIDAIVLEKAEVPPDSMEGLALAKQWWDRVLIVTGGDEDIIVETLRFSKNKISWPESERKLMDAAQGYLEKCMGAYFSSGRAPLSASLIQKLMEAQK